MIRITYFRTGTNLSMSLAQKRRRRNQETRQLPLQGRNYTIIDIKWPTENSRARYFSDKKASLQGLKTTYLFSDGIQGEMVPPIIVPVVRLGCKKLTTALFSKRR
jgi:hypothetical protein